MNDTKRKARHAGRLYLLMGVTAPLGLMIAPSKIFVRGDAAATADHIRNLEWLLRAGIASELFHQALGVWLALALYRVFKDVNETLAKQMVILGAFVSVPIAFMNVLNEVAAIIFAKAPPSLSAAFAPAQLDALAHLAMRFHAYGLQIAGVFWGLWLFPFGTLVIRSGFIPKWIGVAMIAAGAGYVANSFAMLVAPPLMPYVDPVAGALLAGELPIMFWLLIWGAREQRRKHVGQAALTAQEPA
jgi:hypothetical protein